MQGVKTLDPAVLHGVGGSITDARVDANGAQGPFDAAALDGVGVPLMHVLTLLVRKGRAPWRRAFATSSSWLVFSSPVQCAARKDVQMEDVQAQDLMRVRLGLHVSSWSAFSNPVQCAARKDEQKEDEQAQELMCERFGVACISRFRPCGACGGDGCGPWMP